MYDDDAIWSFFIAGIGNLETDDQDGIVFREWLSDHRNRALDVMKSPLREDDYTGRIASSISRRYSTA